MDKYESWEKISADHLHWDSLDDGDDKDIGSTPFARDFAS
jgi:hypothetical protein